MNGWRNLHSSKNLRLIFWHLETIWTGANSWNRNRNSSYRPDKTAGKQTWHETPISHLLRKKFLSAKERRFTTFPFFRQVLLVSLLQNSFGFVAEHLQCQQWLQRSHNTQKHHKFPIIEQNWGITSVTCISRNEYIDIMGLGPTAWSCRWPT